MTNAPRLPVPYVVRFGPWARNLYLGLPAAMTFGLVSVVARMPLPLFLAWNAVVALLVWICAFPREIRVFPAGRLILGRRFLATLPVWWRTYDVSEIRAVKRSHVRTRMLQRRVDIETVFLVLHSGKHVAVQSYSPDARSEPPPDELCVTVARLLGIPEIPDGAD